MADITNPPSKKPRTKDSAPPIFSSTEELSQGSQANSARYDNLVSSFEAKYGRKPQFLARAPGRVNIIGEHIDYCGYAVLPMAIEQDVTIACSTNDRGEISFGNVNETQYPDHTCPVEGFTIDGHTWHNYLLCGFKGIVESLKLSSSVGMDILIDGNIPPSAGLSSSSALVCCAALTTAYANKVDMPSKRELAELCAKCERYIGTEGGGMDQAISFLGAESKALMIEFNPIRPTEVKVPQGVRFIIANSLVLENKAASSAQFNVRVAECRLSAQVIAKVKGKDWRQVRKLLTLQESLGLPLSEMAGIVREVLHPGEYTREELCRILEISNEELQSECLNEKTKSVGSFKLYDRALHVFEEANRVYVFKDTANSADGDTNIPNTLGKLMDDSHRSCSELYECSCKELDELVAVSKSAGALGSRLTGAGWGGCTVSLVAEENVEAYLGKVRVDFYEKDSARMANLTTRLFSTKPGPGAALCSLN